MKEVLACHHCQLEIGLQHVCKLSAVTQPLENMLLAPHLKHFLQCLCVSPHHPFYRIVSFGLEWTQRSSSSNSPAKDSISLDQVVQSSSLSLNTSRHGAFTTSLQPVIVFLHLHPKKPVSPLFSRLNKHNSPSLFLIVEVLCPSNQLGSSLLDLL